MKINDYLRSLQARDMVDVACDDEHGVKYSLSIGRPKANGNKPNRYCKKLKEVEVDP